eukprot:scaffold132642_cov63-Phaeocystis_antarctica.AAC.2
MADLQLPRRPVPVGGAAAPAAAGGFSVAGAAAAKTAQEPREPAFAVPLVRSPRMRREPSTAVPMAGLRSVLSVESVVFT